MIPIFDGNITNGKLTIIKKDKFLEYLKTLKSDVEIIVRKRRKHRSLSQNDYYWGCVIPIFCDYCGYNKISMHESLLAEYSRSLSDNVIPLVIESSAMSTFEFEEYMSWCRIFGSEIGINIPMPREVDYSIDKGIYKGV